MIINIKYYFAPVALGILTALFATNEAQAADVTVKNEAELNTILQNISEHTKILIDSNYETNDGRIDLLVDSKYDVEIDANNVNFYGDSTITDHCDGDLVLKNFLMDGIKESPDLGKSKFIINVGEDKGKFTIKDSTIKNIREKIESPVSLSGDNGSIILDNILMDHNLALMGGGINIESAGLTIKISNSTFSNSTTQEGGGALTNPDGSDLIEITNSKFINNTANLDFIGAGAIYSGFTYLEDHMVIRDSYFANNEVLSSEPHLPSSPGAVSISTVKLGDSVSISGTTFAENKGLGGGGALVINELDPASTNLDLNNNTFYKNSALSLDHDLITGGAVIIYNNFEIGENESSYFMNSTNNTFLENKMIRNNHATPQDDVKGGALGMERSFMKHKFTNDLFVGNGLENNQNSSKSYTNVFLSKALFTTTTTLGFDNGTETTDTVSQVYGKYPVALATNGGKIKAGTKADAEIIPTVMIAPEIGTTGFANMKGTKALDYDQRGFERKGKSDIGAVEISSLLYDANGGEFTLAELTKYDGKTYYEGENPAQYAKVGNPGNEYTIINGKTVLKPVKAGKVFLGWSDVKNDKVAKLKFGAGKKVSVDDQKILYAVWKDETCALKYYNNGKTTGTIPTQKNVKPNTEVTIKTQGKLKRKGYKFSGWSTKPSAKKGEAAYAPGKKLKLVKNTKLYAIWKR